MEDTIKQYQHLISPICGIITHLYSANEGDTNVYLSGHNRAFPIQNLAGLKSNLRTYSSGKGITDTQAKVGALCEAIERFCGEYQDTETCLIASYKNLENAIHPNECMLFSVKQYKNREFINAKGSRFIQVPEQFDVNAEIEWTPVWSLSKKIIKYLPTQYLYFLYGEGKQDNKAVYCNADSNGNAAGNTVEEAILQGFLELVERDSVAIWWYNRLKMPEIILESFHEPYFLEMKKYYASLQREIWMLDVTADLDIPTFVAISRKVNSSKESITTGLGCHFDPKIAAQRALTEMNQMLVMVNAIDEGKKTEIDPLLKNWLDTANIKDLPYLTPDNNRPSKTLSDYRKTNMTYLSNYIEMAQHLVESKGMELGPVQI